jgi:hypothetical protein
MNITFLDVRAASPHMIEFPMPLIPCGYAVLDSCGEISTYRNDGRSHISTDSEPGFHCSGRTKGLEAVHSSPGAYNILPDGNENHRENRLFPCELMDAFPFTEIFAFARGTIF